MHRGKHHLSQEHPFLSEENLRDVDMVSWVEKALVYKQQQLEEQRAKMLAQMHSSV